MLRKNQIILLCLFLIITISLYFFYHKQSSVEGLCDYACQIANFKDDFQKVKTRCANHILNNIFISKHQTAADKITSLLTNAEIDMTKNKYSASKNTLDSLSEYILNTIIKNGWANREKCHGIRNKISKMVVPIPDDISQLLYPVNVNVIDKILDKNIKMTIPINMYADNLASTWNGKMVLKLTDIKPEILKNDKPYKPTFLQINKSSDFVTSPTWEQTTVGEGKYSAYIGNIIINFSIDPSSGNTDKYKVGFTLSGNMNETTNLESFTGIYGFCSTGHPLFTQTHSEPAYAKYTGKTPSQFVATSFLQNIYNNGVQYLSFSELGSQNR